MRVGMMTEGKADHTVMRILWNREALVSEQNGLIAQNERIELRGLIGMTGLTELTDQTGWNG